MFKGSLIGEVWEKLSILVKTLVPGLGDCCLFIFSNPWFIEPELVLVKSLGSVQIHFVPIPFPILEIF